MWGRGLVILAGPGKSLSLWNFNPRQSEVVLCVRKEANSKDSRGWRGSISVGSRPGVRKTCSSGLFSFPCFDRDKHARNTSLSSSLWFQKNNNNKKATKQQFAFSLGENGGWQDPVTGEPLLGQDQQTILRRGCGQWCLIFQFFKRNWKYRFEKYSLLSIFFKKC